VDFDGTVTIDDVGYNFFKRFANGKAEPIVQQYRRGEVSAIECLQAECDIYNEYPASANEVKDFINDQKICSGFLEFVQFCQAKGIKVTILSAGFDFYIRPILNNIGLADIELLATPTIIKQGRIYPEFIRYDKKVCSRCADCKGQRIKELLNKGAIAVFIGDGHSDSHGAEQADIVFAKSFLAEHLEIHNKDYFPYDNFFDIIDIFRNELKIS
jgi:2-hydroxy-3-keto-5-methylthiopentenyl-1-phosphate phosphatase